MLGAVAGYFRGPADRIISAFIDLTWGFPLVLVAVIFVGMLKPGIPAVILGVSVVNWAGFARIGDDPGVRQGRLAAASRRRARCAHCQRGSSCRT